MSVENQQFIVSEKGFNGGSTLSRTRRYLRNGQDIIVDQQRLDTDGLVVTETVRKNTKGTLTYIATRPTVRPSSPKVRLAAFQPRDVPEYIDYLGFAPEVLDQSLLTYAIALLSTRMVEGVSQSSIVDSFRQTESKYSDYTASEYVCVPRNGNIIIADIPFSPNLQGAIEQLSQSNNREIFTYNGRQLTLGLLNLLPSLREIVDNNIAVLFPGAGAETVLNYLSSISEKEVANLYSQDQIIQFSFGRTYTNNSFSVGGYLPEQFNPERYKGILIIDDVVASRRTTEELIKQIKAKCAENSSIPPVDVYAWLTLDPSQAARTNNRVVLNPASVPGARSLKSVVNYKGEAGIPPCNSLSTLLRGDSKSEAVLQSLTKYFPRDSIQKFLETISL